MSRRISSMAVWVVRAGKHGEQEDRVLAHSLAAVDWHEVTDLTGLTRDDIRQQLRAVVPRQSERRIGNHIGQLVALRDCIKPKDLVIIPLRTLPPVAVGKA